MPHLSKSHHNVGGLPDHVDFDEIIEPLRDLFKDEVRKVGLELDMPENMVYRQPFPGPGLGVRIIGEHHTRENCHSAGCRRNLPRGSGKRRA